MDRRFAVLSILALSALAGAALAGCASPGGSAWPGTAGAAKLEEFSLDTPGGSARGLVAVPAGEPTTLIVLAHPWGAVADDYRADLEAMAAAGVLGVAMDFRGDRADFKVRAGVEDTVAATLALQNKYPSVDRTLLYGWSMGGQIAFLAVAAAPPGTYDYVFDGAGVTDLEALWHAFVPARPAIERETGGPPTDVPGEYKARSPVEKVAELKDKGVARYFIVHGAGDSPVPVEQAERLYSRMAEAGLPVTYYVVTTNQDPWVCSPVVTICIQGPPKGLANHEAGGLRLMKPLIDNRIARLPDPATGAVRGTYDGDTGRYEPPDVG